MGLTLDTPYINDYADLNSKASRTLIMKIEKEMLVYLTNFVDTSIVSVKVTALRNGSVVADMTVASASNYLVAGPIRDGINNGITDGSLGLNVTGTITVQGMNTIISLESVHI